MGFLDKLFGPPSKEKFADLMVQALRQAGEKSALRFDAERFCLVAEEGEHTFFLSNAYNEYNAAARASRPDVLRHFVRSWFSRHKEIPKELEDARPDLLPAIRGRGYFEITALQLQADGLENPHWPYRVVADHLALSLVYDLPESMMQINQQTLGDWGIKLNDALALASDNLRDLSLEGLTAVSAGVWQSVWHDNHDASRMVLLDYLRGHDVEGDPVVMVPNRDTLLLTGSADPAGLARLAQLAEQALEHPRPLCGFAFRLDGEVWLPFLPGEDHAELPRFQMLRVKTLGQDYFDQQHALNAIHAKSRTDIHVASFSAMQNQETGQVRSYCVWSQGVESLLPRTDEVYFFQPDGREDGKVVATAAWERVRQVVGHLMEPLQYYPPRYRVRVFPDAKQLAALGDHR